MISYGRQNVDRTDVTYVKKALLSELLTTGKFVDEFEKGLSDFVHTPTFVLTSGTAALHAAYVGVGIGPEDEVITPPNTFIATQAAAAILGARVVFADIDSSTGLVDINSIEKKINKRTKAIVLVDYAGQTCDIDAFKTLAKENKLVLIEDAAHSLGTTYKGKPVGSLADVTTFSFYPTKNITTGEGGAISTNNKDIFTKAIRFARQGLVRNPSDFQLEPDGPWHQEVQEFGLNYRLTDFQCALGISQLKRIGKFKAKRKELFERYKSNFETTNRLRTLKVCEHSDPMWHLFPIFVDTRIRKSLYDHLRSQGYGVQINYFPAHAHPVFARLGYKYHDYPESVRFYESEISLPLHVGLTPRIVDKISQTVVDFISKKK